jgi:hypothetical protein
VVINRECGGAKASSQTDLPRKPQENMSSTRKKRLRYYYNYYFVRGVGQARAARIAGCVAVVQRQRFCCFTIKWCNNFDRNAPGMILLKKKSRCLLNDLQYYFVLLILKPPQKTIVSVL